MANPAYALNLGGGLYIDSEGNLYQSEPPIAPIYEAPFKLPVEPKKVQAVLMDAKRTLKDVDKDRELLRKFSEYGADTGILMLLSGIGKIAGVIAPVFAALSFAVDVANLLGLFKKGTDPLEKLMKERCTILENKIDWVARQGAGFRRSDALEAVQNLSSAVKDKIERVADPTLTLEQLENDRTQLFHSHEVHIDDISNIFDSYLWMSSFDSAAHSVIGWIKHRLVTHPRGHISSFSPLILPNATQPYFDHRLMVPLISYVTTLYLSSIRGIEPEYRTTSEFRERLIGFANKIDGVVEEPTPDRVGLAQKMRHFCIARTRYEPADFQFFIPAEYVVTSPFQPNDPPKLSSRCTYWPVGAVDVRYYDDAALMPFVMGLMASETRGHPHPTKVGALDLRWIPPARLRGAPGGNYMIDNPEECAAAANAQSEQDYAHLLITSGYTQLVELATLLRNEAAEPNRSQTVQAGVPRLWRTAQASSQVTVKSDLIPLTGVIESPARREPQASSARVALNTQPLNRPRPAKYKVKLRTLRSIDFTSKFPRWRAAAYRNHQVVSYEADRAHPGFLELSLLEREALDSHSFFPDDQWLTTPRDGPLHVERTVEMRAHTFDWWIPIDPPFVLGEPFAQTAAGRRAFGWADAQGVPLSANGGTRTLSSQWDPGPFAELSDADSMYLSPSDDLNVAGEYRELREATVQVAYTLDWRCDTLRIDIAGASSDRNYVVFVVVEEQLPRTGKILHTAVPVPVNGQITYVPQQFFNDEREAWRQAQKTFDYYNKKYAEHVDVGPGDPVFGWLRPGDLADPRTVGRVFELLREHRPEILQEASEISLRPSADPTSAARAG